VKVVGYTYDAAMHCPDCTAKYAWGLMQGDDVEILNAIENETLRDSENNPIHPVFDTDESGDSPDHCNDCRAFINTLWIGSTVDYAIEALADYLVNGDGSTQVLDEWANNLQWCNKSNVDQVVIEVYEDKRNREKTP
jgi:hypothetical protein